MKTILSSLALATILVAPLAANAGTSVPATNASVATPATLAMHQNATPPNAKRADDRAAVRTLEQQSRQLGPTN